MDRSHYFSSQTYMVALPSDDIGGGRKEEPALRVTVELNGEQHVFEFAAPGER